MNPPTLLLYCTLVLLLAGVCQGLTGFGFALIAAPLLIILLPPKTVVPIVTLNVILITIFMSIKFKSRVEWKRIFPLMIAGIAGLPLGIYLLVVVKGNILKVAIGIIVTLFAAMSFVGFKKEIKNERIASVFVGFLSGLLKGSTSMSGPPVVLFLTNQDCKKQAFQANVVAYFAVLSLSAIPFFIMGNLMTKQVLRYSTIFIPVTALGTIVGMRLNKNIGEKLFRNITLIISIIAGLLSIISGLIHS
jgi:uncharacterized membrane protein YfcA